MRTTLLACLALSSFSIGGRALGFSSGTSGMSGKPPAQSCNGCHSERANAQPVLILNGPMMLMAGATAKYTLQLKAQGQGGIGLDVAPSDGTLSAIDATATQIMAGDLTHTSSFPKGADVTVEFNLTAPASPGTTVTLFATGLSVDAGGGTTNDSTVTGTLQIQIISPPDFAGVDLSSADMAMASPPDLMKKPAVDEPRWACECGMGRAKRGVAGMGWLAAGMMVLLMKRRRRLA